MPQSEISGVELLSIFEKLALTPAAALSGKLKLEANESRVAVLGTLPGTTALYCIGQRERTILKGEVIHRFRILLYILS